MRWWPPRLPGYRRQPPDPPRAGVMAPGPPVAYTETKWYRKQQAKVDTKFWGLVHDHDWLQYHPFDKRMSEDDK